MPVGGPQACQWDPRTSRRPMPAAEPPRGQEHQHRQEEVSREGQEEVSREGQCVQPGLAARMPTPTHPSFPVGQRGLQCGQGRGGGHVSLGRPSVSRSPCLCEPSRLGRPPSSTPGRPGHSCVLRHACCPGAADQWAFAPGPAPASQPRGARVPPGPCDTCTLVPGRGGVSNTAAQAYTPPQTSSGAGSVPQT